MYLRISFLAASNSAGVVDELATGLGAGLGAGGGASVMQDAGFINNVLAGLPDVDTNDPELQAALAASLEAPAEDESKDKEGK